MYRLILTLSILALVSTSSALGQRATSDLIAVVPSTSSTWVSYAAEPAAEPAASTNLTIDRLRALRALVPASDVTLARQLSVQLRSRDAEIRTQALSNVINYTVNYGDLVDLSAVVPDLLRIFAGDSNPDHRIMASQAICYLANLDTVREMGRMALQDRDQRVRKLAALAAISRIMEHDAR